MNIIETLEILLKENKKTYYFTADKKELFTRCPACGDSVKDSSHAHLYISTESPYMYFCQRCEFKGILNSSLLDELELDDIELSINLNKLEKQYRKDKLKIKSKSIRLSSKLKIPKYEFDKLFNLKLDYIYNRLNIDNPFNRNELLERRIIRSIEDLIVLNNIESVYNNSKLMKFINYVDNNAVSFLSTDNTHVLSRYIGKKAEKRFSIIKLIDPEKNPYSSKIYSFKKQLDIFSPRIEIIQTEGIFDIMSVYHNFYSNEDNTYRLFVSSNGKGFNLFSSSLFKLGFLDIDLKIYSDSDVHINVYRNTIPIDKYNSTEIIYNKYPGEKDFGIPRNRIKLEKYKLK
jgi:hypothetical protein